jgi:ribosomal protein L37AE/L43A
MTEPYRIICPVCGTELGTDRTQGPIRTCPRCNADVSDSYEILYQPAARHPWAKKIAMVIIIGFAAILLLAVLSLYR